jgi:hypothetical protein
LYKKRSYNDLLDILSPELKTEVQHTRGAPFRRPMRAAWLFMSPCGLMSLLGRRCRRCSRRVFSGPWMMQMQHLGFGWSHRMRA